MNKFDFNSLNESFGVVKFDNLNFQKLIERATRKLKLQQNKSYNIKFIDIDNGSINTKFYKFQLSVNLIYVKNITIWYSFDYFVFQKFNYSHAVVSPNNDKIYIYVDPNLNNFDNFYTGLLYHEIAHIYDHYVKHHNDGKDLEYSSDRNIEIENLYNRLNEFNNTDINDFIKNIMYYCNESETHAFNEQVYFQIVSRLTNISNYTKLLKYNQIEINRTNLIKYISNEIGNISDLKNGCKFLIDNINKFEINDLNIIGEKYNKKFNKLGLLKYFYEILIHLWNNILKIFGYFYNKFDIRNQLKHNGINESLYRPFRQTHRFKFDDKNLIIYDM